jgi:predicted translin family RNA/ssDNA-binding protein
MKLDFNYILTNKEIISKNDILTINYITATGKGCFNVLMPAKFPATAHDMNIFIDMFYKTENPEETARTLYDYLTKCVEALKDFRELAKKVDEPANVAQVTNEIKRYNANLEKLCKAFKFEAAEDPEAVKMKKVEVVKQGTKNGKKFVENRTGKKFVKYGHIFHVYKEPKGDCYIIIPCCGIAAIAYNGGIAEAPEHITKDLITKLDKLNFKELNKAFLEVLEGAENVVINNDINIIYNDETSTPEVTEEAPRPEAVEVATAEKPEAVENETTAPATADETENKPRPQNKPPYYIAVIPEAMNHTTTGDSTPASLKRANIPPRPNKGILYHYNAIQGHYSPAGLYSGIKDYTRAYHAQTAPPGLYATGDSLKAGIIRAQTMPNLLYHDTC